MLKKKSTPKVSLTSNASTSLITGSEEETMACARRFAKKLKAGDIVFLRGQLGSGKTTFAKGLAQAFKVAPEKVNSPTFVLMNYYKGKLPIYHFDFYRLENSKTVAEQEIGNIFDEYFYGKGISLIEWPERLGEHKPEQYYLVEFKHKSENERLITMCQKAQLRTTVSVGQYDLRHRKPASLREARKREVSLRGARKREVSLRGARRATKQSF